MKNTIMLLLSETSIHTGSGSTTSIIDNPVTREKITEYPYISSTSIKGALRSDISRSKPQGVSLDEEFGKQDAIGNMSLSDARLFLLPVRSLNTNYKWVTCKYLLERSLRDYIRCGNEENKNVLDNFPSVEKGTAISFDDKSGEFAYLEDRELNIKKHNVGESKEKENGLFNYIERFIPDDLLKKDLKEKLLIVNDDDFKWFAKYGLQIYIRNQLTENKTSNNLWYEEYISPDTIFYTIIIYRNSVSENKLFTHLKENPYLQIGGNESVGQGWFKLKQFGGK